jgi:4-azaleucine resistance transporter AzlC
MRTVWRTRDSALLRDAAALAAAIVAVGASFGAITVAYGLPTWVPFLMSTAVFAGGAQFLAVSLFAAGNPIAAVLAGLLLNARHLPFGLAVARTVGPRWRDRFIGSHLMTDETVAFTLREQDPARRRHTYWLIGITLFASWNAGTALGVWLGGAMGDPATMGLDAAFPAGLIALIMPSLHDRDTRLVAVAGAAIAVFLTPVLPAGLPVLCALVGLLALFLPRRRVGGAGAGGVGTVTGGAGAVAAEAAGAGPVAVRTGATGAVAVAAEASGAGPGGVRTGAAGAAVDREEAPC